VLGFLGARGGGVYVEAGRWTRDPAWPLDAAELIWPLDRSRVWGVSMTVGPSRAPVRCAGPGGQPLVQF